MGGARGVWARGWGNLGVRGGDFVGDGWWLCSGWVIFFVIGEKIFYCGIENAK